LDFLKILQDVSKLIGMVVASLVLCFSYYVV
jgi:hypothetical protein